MIPSARESFTLTTEILAKKVPEAMMKLVAEKIKKAIQEGKGEVILTQSDITTSKSDTKMMKSIASLLISKGYKVENPYAYVSIIIRWL